MELPEKEQDRPAERPLAAKPQADEVSDTFAGMVGPVKPAGQARRTVLGAPTGAAPVRVLGRRPKPELTWARQEETVRGRADGVPERLLEELARGRPLPTREVDLHGLRAARAGSALVDAVTQARRDGVECLLVICGRGKHSESLPVLPEVAIERLSQLGEHVLAFCTAPARLGGSGALLVRLRARGKS